MILRYFFLILLSLFSNLLYSQKGIYLHIGSGTSTLTNRALARNYPQIIFSGGISTNILFNDKNSLNIGLNYSEKGAKGGRGTLLVISENLKSYYLDVPISHVFCVNNKINTIIGINNSFFLESDYRVNKYNKYNNDLRLGIEYKVNHLLSISTIYDNSLIPVLELNTNKLKNQRLILLLNYKIK